MDIKNRGTAAVQSLDGIDTDQQYHQRTNVQFFPVSGSVTQLNSPEYCCKRLNFPFPQRSLLRPRQEVLLGSTARDSFQNWSSSGHCGVRKSGGAL